MANSNALLANLRAGRCSNTAEVRLLRFWEARNINRGGELMSLEMLLIDEADTLVQGSIPAVQQRRFRERLSEGSVYTLSGFDVTRSNPKFKLTDGPISIRFNEGTAFEKLTATARTIPTEHFRFRTHEQILELANSGRQLPDVIGEVRAIRSTITDRIPGAQRVMLTLRVDSSCIPRQVGWIRREPRIVLVTGINPKIVLGKLYLNGTSASRIFFDSDTAVGKDRLPGGETDDTGSSSKVVHAQKIEPLTVAELNEFVLSGDPQIIEFLCTAKVTGIQLADGWCYIGCSLCSKNSSVRNLLSPVPRAMKPMLWLNSNPTGTSSFLGFDKEVAKLIHVQASEAAQIVGIGINAQVDTELPRALADIVGNSYTFQLKLKDFNFTANHQTFTISRLFAAPEIAPIPNFARGCPSTGGPQTVAPGSEAVGAVKSNVAGTPAHLMVHLAVVRQQKRSRLIWKRVPQRKHVWNESFPIT
ncbi:hypothetical protein Bca4012_014964 [Brassica carinata]